MSKPSLQEVLPLRNWILFSDKEISIFQFYFIDCLKEKQDNLTKMQCYELACVAQETQYQMRCLIAMIGGQQKLAQTDFVFQKVLSGYESATIESQYEIQKDPTSYFSLSEEDKQYFHQRFDDFFS